MILHNLLFGKVFGKSFCSCAPSPPPAPDYAGAAKAQGVANVDAARTQGKLNNPNVVSPYGTQTVSYGGGFNQTGYDQAIQNYNAQKAAREASWQQWDRGGRSGPWDVPEPVAPDRNRFITGDPDQATVTHTLAPAQQALLDSSNATKLALSNLAGRGAATAGEVIGKNLDLSGLPDRPGSASDTRTKVMDAMMSRVNEDVDRQKELSNSNLLAAGIPTGSKAYQDAQALNERTRTDARNQAFLASGQEMTRDFQTDSNRRRDALAEMLTERQTPLNEITALQSGSQVSNPFTMPGYAQNTQVGAAPIYGAMQDKAGYNTDIYNAKAAQAGNLQQGLFSLGGAGIMGGAMMSDRRVKSNIVRLGDHPLGIGWYEYDIFGRREQGVMAQELQRVKPEAVVTLPNGYLAVHYDMIGGRDVVSAR